MNGTKETIMAKLTEVISDIITMEEKYEAEIKEKNVDSESKQWYYLNGKTMGAIDAVMKMLTAKYEIEEILNASSD